uniref:Thioredoxin domain-containing protein n=1 Tax=Panagrolaimus sp. JU765 TaxID=591449 RepID=A0AC34R7B8_9BILA
MLKTSVFYILKRSCLNQRCLIGCRNFADSTKKPTKGEDIKIDLKELNEKLEDSLKSGQTDKLPEVDEKYMSFRRARERAEHERSYIFTWKSALLTLGIGGIGLAWLMYMRKMREAEMEKHQKIMAGKAKIGGEWELLNVDGKPEGSKDLLGNWVLMYFGFTHCPDICPDEIEKMVNVVEILNEDKDKIPIIPVFISVDPERDTPERVKKYCAEFSPLIRGYTGSKEQVDKVAKTFRVYHSQGPKTTPDDYIVDHTVIMYLIDPDGVFHDYYGQNRRAREIANIIKTKVLKHEMSKKKKGSLFF